MPTTAAPKRSRKGKEPSFPTLSDPALHVEIPMPSVAHEEGKAVELPVSPPPPSKKKSKKPVQVVAVVTPNGIEGSFTPEPRRPLIAHLPIRSSEVNFQDAGAGAGAPDAVPAEPEPFNPVAVNMFAENQEGFDGPVQPERPVEEPANLYVSQSTHQPSQQEMSKSAPVAETRPMQCFAKVKLMVQFETGSTAKTLPDSTDVACFWCAHAFEGQPCIIPEREVAGVYNVYGNFCCPQCALAYLLQETMDPHVRWERIALLHRIYDREGKGRMSPAPGREVLKLFGGPLTIESYRATIGQGKVRVDTHMPPMVSILGSIDTKPIDFFDSSLKNTLIGSLQLEKTVKAEEGLRLKRTKPLKDRESTLDSVMNIQIRNAAQKK